eukprot:scaffold2357_cov399-Prasinococcus_capsulatus_cf.AAC.2
MQVQPGAAAQSLTTVEQARARKQSTQKHVIALAHLLLEQEDLQLKRQSRAKEGESGSQAMLGEGPLQAIACLCNAFHCFGGEEGDRNMESINSSIGSSRSPGVLSRRQLQCPEPGDQLVSDFVAVVQCRHVTELLFLQLCLGQEHKRQQQTLCNADKDTLKDSLSLLLLDGTIPTCLAKPLHRLVDAGNLAVHGGAWRPHYSHSHQSLNALLGLLHALSFETTGILDENGAWVPTEATERLRAQCLSSRAQSSEMDVWHHKWIAIGSLVRLAQSLINVLWDTFVSFSRNSKTSRAVGLQELTAEGTSEARALGLRETRGGKSYAEAQDGLRSGLQGAGSGANVEGLHFMIEVLREVLPSMPTLARHAVDLMIRSRSMSKDVQVFVVGIESRQILEVAISHRYVNGAAVERLRKLVNRLCDEGSLPKEMKGPFNRIVDLGNKAVHGEAPLSLQQAMASLGSLLGSLRLLRFFNDGLWSRYQNELMEQSSACALVQSLQTGTNG